MLHETITWFEVTERLPDDDMTVLVGLDAEASDPVWLGYYADGEWFDVNGAAAMGVVRWAEMPTGQANNAGAIEQLLELARKYASECADCNGTGRVPFTPQSDKTFQCPDCKDIRDVIASAEGSAP